PARRHARTRPRPRRRLPSRADGAGTTTRRAGGLPAAVGRRDRAARRPRAAGRPLHRRGRGRVPRLGLRGAATVRPHGRSAERRPHCPRPRPRHHLRRHRARRRAGAGRWSTHRAAGGSAIHGRLHEDRHRVLLRHRARRPGQARPAPALHGRGRARGPPPAQRVRRRPRARRATGDRLMSLDKEVTEYASKTPRSRALHEEAVAVMPGGNSRTTTFFDPYPFYFQRGQGAHIWDADGVERLDFNNNYTSLVLGHAHGDVVKAVQGVAENGLSFPGPTEHEIRLAEAITRRMPSLESLRFTNSGTEATMNAVRLAGAFTGRGKIAAFGGRSPGTH